MPETLLESGLVDSLDKGWQGRVRGVGFTRLVGDNNDVEFVSVGEERPFITGRNMKRVFDGFAGDPSRS
jgi:hypothetical protein